MERPHQDGILITRESPEAFEEPIWQYFFPHIHENNTIHTLPAQGGSAEFADFFSDHIRKILLLRKGTRYLSKGNYNVIRIPFLATLFPDAKFIIPVRHPVEHVCSLVRQHELFLRYNAEDDRVSDYLRAAGHYEFGPQRVPVCINEGTCQKVLDAWQHKREHLGYAIQWAEVYRFVTEIAERDASFWADRLFILRYEDLCADPVNVLTRVIDFCGLDHGYDNIEAIASRIKSGRNWSEKLDSGVCREIWEEVSEVAELFGYSRKGIKKESGL